MCGIIGYIGPKDVVPVFSSTGCGGSSIAATTRRASPSCATARSICGAARASSSNLEDVIELDPIAGDYGVGHTRWATHGRPTEENAHPHRDCTGKIVVVHNGIIENYLDLKQELQRQGHKFVTETDTEIVAHLVEREMKDDGLENAVRRALLLMRGLFALVLISADDPGKDRRRPQRPADRRRPRRRRVLRRVRTSPRSSATRATSCSSATRRWRSSRAPASSSPTSSAARSRRRRSACCGIRSWRRRPATSTSCSRRSSSSRRPRAKRSLGRVSQDSGKVFLEEMKISDAQLAAVERVTILACGTSWHAALVGKFMIEQLARVPVEVDYGSEYRYRRPDRPAEHAGDRHHAVGRDGRHAGGAARSEARRRPQHRHLQRRRQHGDARDRRDDLHARRAGDRRGVDQGVHVAARRAVSARRCGSARRAASLSPRRRSRTSTRCCSCRCCSSRR